MIEIPLQAVPNQKITTTLENNLYELTFRTCGNIMSVDIVRNSETIETGIRCEAGVPLIPYEYLEDGNFLILTQNDDYPWYEQFGITQYLVYLTFEEIGGLRAGT